MWTNESERWPKSDGMLHSYLEFQRIISGVDQAVPPPEPKATLLDRASLSASVGIHQCFNSSAVLSCPARSVFVGRLAAAGSGRDGRESCTSRQQGVWCGLQRSPYAQVSIWLEWCFNIWCFPYPKHTHKDTACILFCVDEKGRPQFFMAQ